MEAIYKMDEGYSESQDGGDSHMSVEGRAGEILGMPIPSLAGLPDVVLALSEAERSGKIPGCQTHENAVDAP